MTRTQSPAVALAERLSRPQRIGVFGHRGVGKTTLLTMLYREAVGGRLPGLRLAAADTRTAEYLSDKVLQLEVGQPLPATLGETELRFHLYHKGARVELVVMDYQGEHVALGREEPIRDFLRQCDAVWLCLDVPVASAPGPCLQAQQEVEQLVEDYLSAESPLVPHRPMALVLTKADLLGQPGAPRAPREGPEGLKELVDQGFGMTRHALESHCPYHGLFAVSSLGGPMVSHKEEGEGTATFRPTPLGLDGPLTWLADALRAQDEARLQRLWELAAGELDLLQRATDTLARRYPDAPETAAFQARLRQQKAGRRRRRAVSALAVAAGLFFTLCGYDAWGHAQAKRFTAQHADDPVAVRQHWRSYQAWHPTRNVLRSASAARAEEERLEALDQTIHERERDERLRELRILAKDPYAGPDTVSALAKRFRADFPEQDVDADMARFFAGVKAKHEAQVAQRARLAREQKIVRDGEAKKQREQKARVAYLELQKAEGSAGLPTLIEQSNRWLGAFGGTAHEADVKRIRTAYRKRLDERAFEVARDYSARYPLNFHTRRLRYQEYLDRYPDGAFVEEARTSMARASGDWDRHDFRAVRDHYQNKPGDTKELQVLCRAYLGAHPEGRFRTATTGLLRWTEQVTETREYKVVLKSGSFDASVAHTVSRGASLSVEIEVGGVRYGPSTIVKRSYSPEWDYEFPRKVKWKMGDSVRIYVTDHYFWRRKVAEYASPEGDVLAMQRLAGETSMGPHRVTFESDFALPVLPRIE